jgi:hypothetical protein
MRNAHFHTTTYRPLASAAGTRQREYRQSGTF